MNSVIKGASYVLVHTPDMVLYNGTTQTTERVVNPDSEYLKAVPEHLRSYEEAVSYWPNQTYIGNAHPDELAEIEFPYYDKKKEGAERYGKYGEIMPEEEFLLLVQACDMFEVVRLDKAFVEKYKEAFAKDPVISDDIVEKIHEGVELSEIETLISEDHAEPLYFEHQLVGCVKPAHDIDVNLSSHVMHENLMSKASSVLALLYAVKNAGIEKSDVEYVIDCAEEACGDMNQRGTGSAPQNVIGSLVADPLDRAGMKITDIDKFSPEMQNPDITKPAGAGDVPLANYKMIGALAVKRGELDRKELANFTKEHGLTGWAPTQGHIPSGVPYVGFAREDILDGKIKNAMIIGKGSLFLGRMTNLFDGVSFVIHGNTAAVQEEAAGVSEEEVKGLIAKAMKEFAATLMAE